MMPRPPSRAPARSTGPSWHHPIGALLRLAVVAARDLRVALGAVLLAGGALAVFGTWFFLQIAEVVGEGTLQEFDDAALRWVREVDAPWMMFAMREITALGNVLVVFTLATVAGLFLWLTRHRYSAALLLAATAGGVLVNAALKAYFSRPRPDVVEWATHVSSPSFPSGHATAAAVVYLTVAYLAARLQRPRWARLATLLIASAVVLLIAFSRVALGVHYPTDVVAGMAIGLAWAAFCMAALEAVQRFIVREAPQHRVHEEPAPDPDAGGATTAPPRGAERTASRAVERDVTHPLGADTLADTPATARWQRPKEEQGTRR